MCELGNWAGLYVPMSRVDKGDWPWPSELTYRSRITRILDKNLEKVQESAEINACWKESGAREWESQGKWGPVTGMVERGIQTIPWVWANKGHRVGWEAHLTDGSSQTHIRAGQPYPQTLQGRCAEYKPTWWKARAALVNPGISSYSSALTWETPHLSACKIWALHSFLWDSKSHNGLNSHRGSNTVQRRCVTLRLGGQMQVRHPTFSHRVVPQTNPINEEV